MWTILVITLAFKNNTLEHLLQSNLGLELWYFPERLGLDQTDSKANQPSTFKVYQNIKIALFIVSFIIYSYKHCYLTLSTTVLQQTQLIAQYLENNFH